MDKLLISGSILRLEQFLKDDFLRLQPSNLAPEKSEPSKKAFFILQSWKKVSLKVHSDNLNKSKLNPENTLKPNRHFVAEKEEDILFIGQVIPTNLHSLKAVSINLVWKIIIFERLQLMKSQFSNEHSEKRALEKSQLMNSHESYISEQVPISQLFLELNV